MSDATEVRKLPVWRTVKAAYLVIFYNPKFAIKLAAVPFVLSTAEILIVFHLWGGMTEEQITQTTEANGIVPLFVALLSFIAGLAVIPMITAWHRLVLLGKDHPDARILYSIGRTEWGYIWKLILFMALCLLAMIPPTLIIFGFISSGGQIAAHYIIVFVVLFLVLPLYAIIFRLSLVFPSAAIGVPLGFGESWRLTRKNTWRIIFAIVLSVLPLGGIMGAINFILTGEINFHVEIGFGNAPDISSNIYASIIMIPIWLVSLCISVSVWSWCYRYFVQKEPITLPGESTVVQNH